MFDVQRLICQKYLTCQDLRKIEEINNFITIDASVWNFKKYLKLENLCKDDDDGFFWFNRCKKLKFLKILNICNFTKLANSLQVTGLNKSLEKIVISYLDNFIDNDNDDDDDNNINTTINDFKKLNYIEFSNINDRVCLVNVLNFLRLRDIDVVDDELKNLETLILKASYGVEKLLYINDKFKNLKTLKILEFFEFYISPYVYNNLENLTICMQKDSGIQNLLSIQLHCQKLKKLTLKFTKYCCIYTFFNYHCKSDFDFLKVLKTIVENNKNLKHLTFVDYFSKKSFYYQKDVRLCKFFDEIKNFVTIKMKCTGKQMKFKTLNLYKEYVTALLVIDKPNFINFLNLRELRLFNLYDNNDKINVIKALNVLKKNLKKLFILDYGDERQIENLNLFHLYLDKDNNIETLQFSQPFYDFKLLSICFPNLKHYKQIDIESASFSFEKISTAIEEEEEESNKNVQFENCRKFKVSGTCFRRKNYKLFFIEFYVKHV